MYTGGINSAAWNIFCGQGQTTTQWVLSTDTTSSGSSVIVLAKGGLVMVIATDTTVVDCIYPLPSLQGADSSCAPCAVSDNAVATGKGVIDNDSTSCPFVCSRGNFRKGLKCCPDNTIAVSGSSCVNGTCSASQVDCNPSPGFWPFPLTKSVP